MDEVNHNSQSVKALRQALSLTGSFSNLARVSGISKNALRSIVNNKHKPTMATVLRLQAFVEHNQARIGRPFKKENNQHEKGMAA